MPNTTKYYSVIVYSPGSTIMAYDPVLLRSSIFYLNIIPFILYTKPKTKERTPNKDSVGKYKGCANYVSCALYVIWKIKVRFGGFWPN